MEKFIELGCYVGQEFEPSAWIEVDQARIDAFAECTLDRQFIHVDVERAANTPFGGTIAHGFLILSLLAPLCVDSVLVPQSGAMGLNYGFNRIRFLNPVRAGKLVRARVKVLEIDDENPRRILVTYGVTVETQGEHKPALIAEWLVARIS